MDDINKKPNEELSFSLLDLRNSMADIKSDNKEFKPIEPSSKDEEKIDHKVEKENIHNNAISNKEQNQTDQSDKKDNIVLNKSDETTTKPNEEEDIQATKETNKKAIISDINFVHGLYNASNFMIPKKINGLFTFLILFIFCMIIWGNYATVDELTRGDGKVIPSSKIQKVQYLDGGIVADILVKEGEHVTKGQPLLKIDTTRVQASFEETQENIYSLEVKRIRLEAEMKADYNEKLPKLKFPKELQENAQQYIKSEKQVFRNKFYERKNNLKVLKLQYMQRKQELKEIEATVSQLETKLKLEQKQYKAMEQLVKSGSKSKLELIDKEKEVNQIKDDLQTAKLSISRTKLSIQESKANMDEKIQTAKSDVSVKLQETIAEIKKIKSRLITDNDKLEKTVLKSPATGIIKQININTIGAVVRSGDDLMEIVPDSDILYVEAKIDPKDIAFISPDLKVLVKLTAYDFSIYGGLKGKIMEISADSIVDKDSKDGKSYYKVIVKTDKNYLEYNGEKLQIIPGMVASVDIVTGKKTIMDFFLKPILKVRQGALHER
jgi:adhesin transport system membrane fusion protein